MAVLKRFAHDGGKGLNIFTKKTTRVSKAVVDVTRTNSGRLYIQTVKTEQMMNALLYIHGKDGSATESEHYKQLFPDGEVIGLDYQTFTPWDTGKEIYEAVKELKSRYENIVLIANSIGAFFCMNAGIDDIIQKAFFISPIVDMERLITDMMKWANVTEQELESKGVVHTGFGEDLSWDYLCYVRNHPVKWRVPTHVLFGSNDQLTSLETITEFANKYQSTLTVMNGGEHWFHTEEQMKFLDNWIKKMELAVL